MLCSKSFLFLDEGRAASPHLRLNDWELASRLSYFLWSTMPDERLLDLAREGIARATRSSGPRSGGCLRDPKAAAFAESFPRQWLQLRRWACSPPDKKLYPDYDEYLEKSMVAETTASSARCSSATSASASSSTPTGRCLTNVWPITTASRG